MSEKSQSNRWRCLVTGCNPTLIGSSVAESHREETGHRIAKWPVRSKEGQKTARRRNRTGYYDKYNVGSKSWESRGSRFDPDYAEKMNSRKFDFYAQEEDNGEVLHGEDLPRF